MTFLPYYISTKRACVPSTAQPAVNTSYMKRVVARQGLPRFAIGLVADRTHDRVGLNPTSYAHLPFRRHSDYVQGFHRAQTGIHRIHTVLDDVLIGMLRGRVQPILQTRRHAHLVHVLWYPQFHPRNTVQKFILLFHIHLIVLITTFVHVTTLHFHVMTRERTLQPRQVHMDLWNLFLAIVPLQSGLRR